LRERRPLLTPEGDLADIRPVSPNTSEVEIKSALGIESWRNLSKDKFIGFLEPAAVIAVVLRPQSRATSERSERVGSSDPDGDTPRLAPATLDRRDYTSAVARDR
jgi:hypothetical protein